MKHAFWLTAVFAVALPVAQANNVSFAHPPAEDRPWVYWFWKNGNISREGITADLEAMQRVGIGGVILMEVSLSVPPGKYTFFSPEWRDVFAFAVEEADRLGLVISMNSAPGWTGSGGPWVTPEQSMQKVVFGETEVSGPASIASDLPQPETVHGFYRDICVLAFPSVRGAFRIDDIAEKAFYKRGPFSSQPSVRASLPAPAEFPTAPADSVVPRERILDISTHMDANGRLTWDAPAGTWTVLRVGHTSTGQTNRPAPLPGLECDKLDPTAVDAHFRAFIDVLLSDIDPAARRALAAVHLDSWEVGAQNWTPRFRDEFRARRGYDLLPFLPVMTGRVVDSIDVSERCLWDLRQTVSELIVENHGERLRALAKERGILFSVEPYDMTPCDDMSLGATGDVPMCEFWSKGFDTRYSVTEATSVAHLYGKPVVAAEAFTSIDRWLFHPGTIKAQGDWAFCQGVNRLVFHRYVHQPYLNVKPGFSLGPHGLHYERTQTWWDYAGPWHEYVARCQRVLKQGAPVADVLYLAPEGAPNVFLGPDPAPRGYKFDACTPSALMTLATVDDGAIAFASGARYRVLVLPNSETMTPALLTKVRDLAAAGVRTVGAPPRTSPSLTDWPRCDDAVRQLAAEIWKGANTGRSLVVLPRDTESARSPSDGRRAAVTGAHWIWHAEADGASPPPPGKRYFVRVFTLPETAAVRSARIVVTADNAFALYVNGTPAASGDNLTELFDADAAPMLRPGPNVLAVAAENRGGRPNAAGVVAALDIQLDGGGSVRIVTDGQWMSSADAGGAWTTDTEHDGWTPAQDLGPFGMAPWEDVGKMASRIDPYPDSSQVEELLRSMGIAPDFETDAPLDYTHRRADGRDIYFVSNQTQNAIDTVCTFRVADAAAELWSPETGRVRPLLRVSATNDGRTAVTLRFDPLESYFVVFRPRDPNGPAQPVSGAETGDFPVYTEVAAVSGPWAVAFDPNSGGPEQPVAFETLTDWSQHTNDAVRYYSGTAVYTTKFDVPAAVFDSHRPLYLDLGRVEVMASVRLNGVDLGIAWKRPFRVPLGAAAKAGANALEVRVVNLWPNRMIGDERLPPDSERNESGALERWPEWVLAGKPSPAGRYTFATWRHWTADDPLQPSGLLGPVRLLSEE